MKRPMTVIKNPGMADANVIQMHYRGNQRHDAFHLAYMHAWAHWANAGNTIGTR